MGSLGSVPPCPRYYGELRLLALIPPRFLSFVRRYHRWLVYLFRTIASPIVGLGLVSGLPVLLTSVEATRSPSFLGVPLRVRRVLRLRLDFGSSRSRSIGAASTNPGGVCSNLFPLSKLNARLSRSLCTLRRRRHRRRRNTRYRPVASLCRAGLSPAETLLEVSASRRPPPPGLCWRTRVQGETPSPSPSPVTSIARSASSCAARRSRSGTRTRT